MALRRFLPPARILAAGLCLVGAGGAALAQPAGADTQPAKARFAVLPPKHPELQADRNGLTTWNFGWSYQGQNFNARFVGTKPTAGAATTTPVFVIPIKIVVGGKSFSTKTKQSNGKTALRDTLDSPMFKSDVDFVSAGANLGRTQYIDAYQRGDFWRAVRGNPGWHTLLGDPTVLPEQTIDVPANQGRVGTEFGVKVALADINFMDNQFAAIMAAHPEITSASLPIFVAYDSYFTEGGCCIGGYHSANGSQTYMEFNYIGTPGAFSQDVSALSHEVGEWLLDPFVNNNSPCGILENGDPLEREANFGGFPYTGRGGMIYNLQDLVWMPYFGAPKKASLNKQFTLQGTPLTVCQNGA